MENDLTESDYPIHAAYETYLEMLEEDPSMLEGHDYCVHAFYAGFVSCRALIMRNLNTFNNACDADAEILETEITWEKKPNGTGN